MYAYEILGCVWLESASEISLDCYSKPNGMCSSLKVGGSEGSFDTLKCSWQLFGLYVCLGLARYALKVLVRSGLGIGAHGSSFNGPTANLGLRLGCFCGGAEMGMG